MNYRQIYEFLISKKKEFRERHGRYVSTPDLFTDRWDLAKLYGFGQGSSCYDNVLVIGDVQVGRNVWIGPNVILDGSGGLSIGDYVSISAGVQIYTHNSVKWSNSMGKDEIERKRTNIGSGVYLGPNSVIQMGVSIGNRSIIGAMSFVNKDIPEKGVWYGTSLHDGHTS